MESSISAFQAVRGSAANNPAARDPFLPIVLVAVVFVTATVGAFDAVLLLAAPSLIVWAALGAMSQPGRAQARSRARFGGARRRATIVAIAALAIAFALSLGKLVAMQQFGNGERIAGVRRASYWDPGSYRIQIRLAELSYATSAAAMRGRRRRARRRSFQQPQSRARYYAAANSDVTEESA